MIKKKSNLCQLNMTLLFCPISADEGQEFGLEGRRQLKSTEMQLCTGDGIVAGIYRAKGMDVGDGM